MSDFIQVIVNGLLIGGVYALAGIGLSLIFGVMKIVNFAHGAFMMLSMYVLWLLFRATGIPPYLLLPVAIVGMFLIGFLTERVLIHRVVGKSEENSILLTVGLAAILHGLALTVWGPDYRSLPAGVGGQAAVIADVHLPAARLIAFVVSVTLVGVMEFMLRNTSLGYKIRACAENPESAQLLGISPRAVYSLAFGLGIALAAVAGGLLAPIMFFFPLIGEVFLLSAFVVVVLGGLGDIRGALVAGLVVGIVESLVSTYGSLELARMAVFGVFILILLVRPQGLFGRAEAWSA